MKAYLLYRDRSFDLAGGHPPGEAALVQDLELTTLFAAMAQSDRWVGEVVPRVVLESTADVDTIRYRQEILKDCVRHAEVVRGVYALAVRTIDAERKIYGAVFHYPSSTLHRSIQVMEMLIVALKELRETAEEQVSAFQSDGFRTLFGMLVEELGDSYLETIQYHLKELRFARGVLISARLGEGSKGADYVLRKENPRPARWSARVVETARRAFGGGPPTYSFQLAPRDESGARALGELRDRGINLAANALAQSADHVLSFFAMLRTELAFYVGCLNLLDRTDALGVPYCWPQPFASVERRHAARGLYDVCLALTMGRAVVGNELAARGKTLVIVTGANQGGKSTFLRSVGLAQVMMQCGMFVPAESFETNACERIFTHYKREEDSTMKSGKFDEELSRLSAIVDCLVPNSIVLFNESFASTNEREGSEIARQVVSALTERQIKILFVTHQYDFAQSMHALGDPAYSFLRAERRPDGTRSFKVVEGEPLPTSFGQDLYARIFTEEQANPRVAGAAVS